MIATAGDKIEMAKKTQVQNHFWKDSLGFILIDTIMVRRPKYCIAELCIKYQKSASVILPRSGVE